MSRNRLTKSSSNKMLFGVCGGIAEYWGWDATIVRIIFVIASLIWYGLTDHHLPRFGHYYAPTVRIFPAFLFGCRLLLPYID